MGRKKKPIPVATVKVIRDCRNGRLDYKLPAARAKELYAAGKLQWDLTNGTYCTPTQMKVE